MLTRPITFIPNEPDDLHCLQASVRMAWQGLTGSELSAEEAERLTGFVSAQQSWPFAAMLGLAERGLWIHYVEDFDPHGFTGDPESEIRRQSGDEEVVRHILEVSDVQQERARVQRCVEHPRITFDRRVPTLDDLGAAVNRQATGIICNVNYKALVGDDGYTGHFVLVDRIVEEGLRLQNPGLPPIPCQLVDIDRFCGAWKHPKETMGNALIVSSEGLGSPDDGDALTSDQPVLHG